MRVGLFGHTHKEEIAVTQPIHLVDNIGLNFVTGSLSTYTNRNPSFAVITFDADTMIPLDYKTYSLDIVKANALG